MREKVSRIARSWAGAVGALGLGLVVLSGCGATPTASAAPPTPTGELFVQVDQVSVAKETSCWVMSVYHPGEGVYFRAKIFDPVSGKPMGKTDLQAVTVTLPNSQTLTMTYSGHPGTNPTDSFWGVLWKVPADYPTGTVDYAVTAKSNDGRTGKWVDWNISSSQLTIA